MPYLQHPVGAFHGTTTNLPLSRIVHPFSRDSYPAGAIYKQGRGSSIVEVTRFELPSFKMESQGLAEWFGVELSRMVVDHCL